MPFYRDKGELNPKAYVNYIPKSIYFGSFVYFN